jgi:demethylmenaquinone methyltransferase/2-methoxy-6-polyprenyl-1,4-benzoquinol methylase
MELGPPPALAERIFAPLGPTYARWGRILSFGQDPCWRRFLVSRLREPAGAHVLDVATGTGLVASELLRRGYRVTGVDQSAGMLATAHERLGADVELREARAEELPFADASFDALTFTYLLRYVDDPAATLAELARVVRPGGTIAMLEFGLPRGIWRALWELYVRIGLPTAGRLISPAWHDAGRILGPTIRRFHQDWPAERLEPAWREAGMEDVHAKRLSLGGGLVMWARRSA